jgi:hypothetical protein
VATQIRDSAGCKPQIDFAIVVSRRGLRCFASPSVHKACKPGAKFPRSICPCKTGLAGKLRR